jgi:hypothetical protein
MIVAILAFVVGRHNWQPQDESAMIVSFFFERFWFVLALFQLQTYFHGE